MKKLSNLKKLKLKLDAANTDLALESLKGHNLTGVEKFIFRKSDKETNKVDKLEFLTAIIA